MSIKKSEKQELLEKLNELIKKQSLFQQEINELQLEIATLQVYDLEEGTATIEPTQNNEPIEETVFKRIEIPKTAERQKDIRRKKEESIWEKSGFNAEIEKFIGENLINKIGIAVLIIGVGIGVKYAIDNDLISPLVRIILGYLVGFGLAGFAIRLKAKYLNFSAVLFSGAMAVQYFITYAANSYYNLFPQIAAISIMVIITILTVALALYYNQQVIAHFGLVGAYIVPYLLKEPFLNVTILFIYMAIINVGILFISTKRKWKPLNYLAFIATWTIFISWFKSENYNNQLATCLIFLSLFFTIFYLVFLSFKLLQKEKFKFDDIFLLLINSGILYLVGYIAIQSNESSKTYLGLFTLINAMIHAASTYVIYKSKPGDKNLFYWTIGLVITFITIAVQVQFNNYITAILWSVEAALIFWYGRSKNMSLYEFFSYAIIFILFIVTAKNWTSVSYNFRSNEIQEMFKPIFNAEFLSSAFVIISFAFIFYIINNSKKEVIEWPVLSNIFNVLFPLFFLLVIYFTFFTEISLYWNNIQLKASFELNSDGIWEKKFDNLNSDIMKLKGIWLLNYTLLFATLVSYVNFKWLKNNDFNAFILVFHFFLIILFLTNGLIQLFALGVNYLHPELNTNPAVGFNYFAIRYISLAYFVLLIYSTYRFVIIGFKDDVFRKIFEITLSISIIWVCSSELITWLSINGSTDVYKHWLSILWGIFSLLLVSYGIWKKKKHLRVFAIILFFGTLAKLFFYDLTNLETIPKTIVFVLTGALLLIVSFLYNKYTKIIFEEK